MTQQMKTETELREFFEKHIEPVPYGMCHDEKADYYRVVGYVFDNREPPQSEDICEAAYNASYQTFLKVAAYYEQQLAEKDAKLMEGGNERKR